ncbi:DinB family protein [Streptomyces sp. NPDC005263]|uniref:DinB family protein n=1 Tax=Streptomyces sp. NPDC005263 TaxID=3364711 RepID=UPI0036A71F1F
MTESHAKADLLHYLQAAREALVWKLDGLSEYDIRRPLTPTGTNLLGLVKHVAGVELGYFGDTFGRPFFTADPPPWWYTEDAEPNADMWATADESREDIVGLYQQAWEHSDRTFAALPLDAVGHVPWWPEERRATTLHHLAVRVLTDTHRHAGHADIVRELIDGSVGWVKEKDDMPAGDQAWWAAHHRRLEAAAREADKG